MFIVEFIVGAILFALATYVFWRIGDEHAISPRWRNSTAMPSLMVLVVLGGWSGGISLVIRSVLAVVSG
jgi:hypothetical protein